MGWAGLLGLGLLWAGLNLENSEKKIRAPTTSIATSHEQIEIAVMVDIRPSMVLGVLHLQLELAKTLGVTHLVLGHALGVGGAGEGKGEDQGGGAGQGDPEGAAARCRAVSRC